MVLFQHLQSYLDIHANATLHSGCSQAMTEHSSATKASLLLAQVEFLQLLLCIDLAILRTAVRDSIWYSCIPILLSKLLNLYHLPSPIPSFILHNNSLNKTLVYPVFSSASQRTLPDTGDIINSCQNKRQMQRYCAGLDPGSIALSKLTFCCCSVAKSCLTLCDPMDCSMPGSILYYLPEFAQIHAQWDDDAIQPSQPLLPPFPPALNHSQQQGLFQWVSSLHQMAKVLELQLQYKPSQWIFKVDFL